MRPISEHTKAAPAGHGGRRFRIGGLFADVEVVRWDAPLLALPSREAVRDYLVGKGVAAGRAESAARSSEVPLSVTKRGALVFARRD